MKKKINIILAFVILLVIKITNCDALKYGGCEYTQISKLKSFVTNINIYYDYHISNNTPYFDVTITNLVPGIYMQDSNTNKIYNYSDSKDGEIVIKDYDWYSGNYKFYSALSECYGISLGTKYYNFPTYNIYYGSELCKDIKNFSLCQKWAKINYSSSEFLELVNEYKESLNKKDETIEDNTEYKLGFLDEIVNLYVNYYYYFY